MSHPRQFKVEYLTPLGWLKQYVWTTSPEKALRQVKAILGESAGLEWRDAEEV
jgi:hypothetical protein